MRIRSAGCLIAASLISLVSLSPIHGQSTILEEAARLEKQDDLVAARKLYREALSRLPADAGLFAAYDGFSRLESGLGALLDSTREFLSKAKDVAFPGDLTARIARLFELSGRVEEALSLYEKEYSQNGSSEALSACVRLRIEINDCDGASALLELKPDLKERELLEGRIALQRGDMDGARDHLGKALEADASVEAMYWMYALAVERGNPKEIAEAAARLEKAFPLSPEAAIAGSAAASERATPGGTAIEAGAKARVFIAPTPPISLNSMTDASVKNGRKVSIQVGSYLVRENAEDMVLELKKRGFADAVVREESVSEKKYFKAFAAVSRDAAEADGVLERLRGCGFEGFLLYEDR